MEKKQHTLQTTFSVWIENYIFFSSSQIYLGKPELVKNRNIEQWCGIKFGKPFIQSHKYSLISFCPVYIFLYNYLFCAIKSFRSTNRFFLACFHVHAFHHLTQSIQFRFMSCYFQTTNNFDIMLLVIFLDNKIISVNIYVFVTVFIISFKVCKKRNNIKQSPSY